MYPFDSSSTSSSSSSSFKKSSISFPVQSTNHINKEYLARMHDIIASSKNSNEIKPIELSIYRRQSIPIHRFASDSPTTSTYAIKNQNQKISSILLPFSPDDDEYDDLNINGPLIFVNSSLNLSTNSNNSTKISEETIRYKSRLSERSEKEHHHHQNRKSVPNHPTNYTRLPHSLRNKNPSFQSEPLRPTIINNPSIRRPYPQFQSVRTPVQKSPSKIPSELFDCCQT